MGLGWGWEMVWWLITMQDGSFLVRLSGGRAAATTTSTHEELPRAVQAEVPANPRQTHSIWGFSLRLRWHGLPLTGLDSGARQAQE